MTNTLFLMVGLPGSGKSTISREIERRTGAIRLESDEMRREMFPERSYSWQESKRLFNRIRFLTWQHGTSGRSVIVDSTSLTEEDRKPFLGPNMAREFEKVLVVIVETPMEVCLERLANKTEENLSEAGAEVYQRLALKERGEITAPHIRVFGTARTDLNVDAILEMVQ